MDDVLNEFQIKDYDAGNPREKMFLGIITKLRDKRRTLANELETTTARFNALNDEVTTFRRTARETEIINEVLGEDKEIADKAKFEKWKAKLSNGDNWEDDLRDLVTDFSATKAKNDPPKSDQKTTEQKTQQTTEQKQTTDQNTEEQKTEQKKPGYQPRHTRGGGDIIPGTSVHAPRTASEAIKLRESDPEAYEEWRNQQGRRR